MRELLPNSKVIRRDRLIRQPAVQRINLLFQLVRLDLLLGLFLPLFDELVDLVFIVDIVQRAIEGRTQKRFLADVELRLHFLGRTRGASHQVLGQR